MLLLARLKERGFGLLTKLALLVEPISCMR